MRNALLIIDMSNDFVHDEGTLTAGRVAQDIVPNIVQLADRFLKNGDVVAFCMDAHEENDPHFQLWPPHNVKGTWGQQLYGALNDWYEAHRRHRDVLFVPKPEYDAFYQTDLDRELKARGVGTVHITGVCTDICDFLTAYGAYARGYQTVVYRDATATFTGQHDLFLKHMNAVFRTEIR
ncbi:cysteine hydrolase family protein [Caenibacillus caldisaponilyticus]|uniref:cysteine hydrolase family protein n=1 Tax=Caenibacillus caldisaponilyticus TaxID=1674942 RepID=UPI001874D6B9|nr:isochorismatase family cysteine hydrolase [Caenibacillus caldisaponilyticus]